MPVLPAFPLLWMKKGSGKLFYRSPVSSRGINREFCTAFLPPSDPTKLVSHLSPKSEPPKTGLSTGLQSYS
jgi:hypothetical protein